MGSALHLPEWHLGNKDSRLGPLETREKEDWGRGRCPKGWRSRGCLVWGWLLSPEPTLSPVGLRSWTWVPFEQMTSFLSQASATSHPNGLWPQQDHPDSGRYHLSPPTRGQRQKGGGGREAGISGREPVLRSPRVLPCISVPLPGPALTSTPTREGLLPALAPSRV